MSVSSSISSLRALSVTMTWAPTHTSSAIRSRTLSATSNSVERHRGRVGLRSRCRRRVGVLVVLRAFAPRIVGRWSRRYGDGRPLHLAVRVAIDRDEEMGPDRTVRVFEGYRRFVDLFPVLANEDAAFLLAEQDRRGLHAALGLFDGVRRKLPGGNRILPGLNGGEGHLPLGGLAALRFQKCGACAIDVHLRGGPRRR